MKTTALLTLLTVAGLASGVPPTKRQQSQDQPQPPQSTSPGDSSQQPPQASSASAGQPSQTSSASAGQPPQASSASSAQAPQPSSASAGPPVASSASAGQPPRSSSPALPSGAPGGNGPKPYTPAGGLGTNSTPPVYHPLSDFDFQSINLALNQEWIELDLFHYGLARFSVEDFENAGLNAEDRFLIQFMADQEVGHAELLSNILGSRAAKQCQYRYYFQTVREYVDFCQKLTRFGESGVYGFLEHLDSRASAQLLLQSITTEARQQMIFRQFEGLFPMPVWFEAGISQSMAWTLLAPYIVSCPAENPRIEWQNFPALNITNNPDATPLWNTSIPGNDTTPAITHNRSIPLSYPGRELYLTWELPGQNVSYNNSYTTSTSAGSPRYVAWVSQLNTTYSELVDINGQSGRTYQPGGTVFGDNSAPIVNGTMFIMITDDNVTITPANISMLNSHVVAGPALYQSG